jgi:Fur family ferric uptake transcriptional regulator
MTDDIFKKFLEERCLKLTRERRQIYAEILELGEHFDVDTLLFRLKNRGRKASKATIYRTLQLLMEFGLIKKLNLSPEGTAESLYGVCPDRCAYDNLICSSCGKIVAFDKGDICKVCEAITQKHGYVLQSHCLSIFALCPECR